MNRLAQEKSPYLLQHADNPVDWYPWGEEALNKARTENKPIFLSIGYSACHWCHVMAHESFENPQIAAQINANFIPIKVDREERPDLDAIYMSAVQAMTGSGGWPLSVFLTPEGVPYYGGTYFPPEDRQGMPGLPRILDAVASAYRDRPQEVARSQESILRYLQRDTITPAAEGALLTPTLLDQAVTALVQQFDMTNGGFGDAPKFPQAMTLDFLLRYYAQKGDLRAARVVERSLDRMARGGIYDHLGGGFHRYSVDARWLVPHFEKMLYDNALLSRLYLHAAQQFNRPFFQRVAEETLDYVQREMTSPEGGFYSTEDADSEGEEGKFYLWTRDEILDILGPEDGVIFNQYYGLRDGANFEGKNILYIPRDDDVTAHLAGVSEERMHEVLRRGRQKLLSAREKRVRPGRDEKVLASWNGWMLQSFAEAARLWGREDYLRTATRNGEFLLDKMRHDGRLWHTYRDGQAQINGYLEDYGGVAVGLLALWEATFDPRWFVAARELGEAMLAHFRDPDGVGLFDTSDDHERLIVRPKSFQDNATPSGNALAADLLLRLYAYTGEAAYHDQAASTLRAMAPLITQYPQAFGYWLGTLDFYLAPPREIAIIGDPQAQDTQALLQVVYAAYRPSQVVAVGQPGSEAAEVVPLLAERPQQDGKATAYVCHNMTCQTPVTDPAELQAQLGTQHR